MTNLLTVRNGNVTLTVSILHLGLLAAGLTFVFVLLAASLPSPLPLSATWDCLAGVSNHPISESVVSRADLPSHAAQPTESPVLDSDNVDVDRVHDLASLTLAMSPSGQPVRVERSEELLRGGSEGRSFPNATWLPEEVPRVGKEKEDSAAEQLHEEWSVMYGLANDSPPLSILPRGGWIDDQDFPVAPHMQDCELLTNMRADSEKRGENGEPPKWLSPRGGLQDADPPWVQGSDRENLAMTRYTQAFLWNHQHPRDCTFPGLKFAVADWTDRKFHGLGSMLHFMAQVLGAVLQSNRILVPGPFERAQHEQCAGDDYGSLNCYFFPTVSRECEKQALLLLAKQPDDDQRLDLNRDERLSLPIRVISLHDRDYWDWPRCDYWKPPGIGEPWLNDTESLELLGSILSKEEKGGAHSPLADNLPATWWRAQVVRYMLRWPSKRTCHATNHARHEAYGPTVARQVVHSVALQRSAVDLSRLADPSEAEILAKVQVSERSLEHYVWKYSEPFIPRPIVSVHVRQGDKGSEMRLFSFAAFMSLAARLRRHAPDVSTVWLSSEMQGVIDETRLYPDWTFLYTKNKREQGSMVQYEASIGMHRLIVLSFANLIIAGECDYFIGVLGSNWNRLINELRLTGGKLSAGILALNYDEW